jgi:hypothetical protein
LGHKSTPNVTRTQRQEQKQKKKKKKKKKNKQNKKQQNSSQYGANTSIKLEIRQHQSALPSSRVI